MIVLDASALLALLNGEPGSEVVERAAAEDDTTISAINSLRGPPEGHPPRRGARRRGRSPRRPGRHGQPLRPPRCPPGRLLLPPPLRLSLTDRVCLALARSLASPAFTTDRLWQTWADDLGVRVTVIR
jgi:ribonuclease VapC